MDIWFEVRAHSSVFKEAALDITTSDPIDSESMDGSHLRMRRVAESSTITKNCLGALKKSIWFRKSRWRAASRMGFGCGRDIFAGMRNILSIEREKVVEKYKSTGSNKERKAPVPTSQTSQARLANSNVPPVFHF